MILVGLMKKVVVADRLSIYVDTVYDNSGMHNGSTLVIATVFFAIQIYCDFSGYTDIAIGSARIFGVKLMENFRRPYFSQSIGEFWSRWHISLSTWFRDYLYIPLGGSRVHLPRWLVNLLITFVISGLWHGASWTFVIWGTINGIYLCVEVLIRKRFGGEQSHGSHSMQMKGFFKIIACFALINFSWIFFRASSVREALGIIRKILFDVGTPFIGSASQMGYCLMAVGLLFLYEINSELSLIKRSRYVRRMGRLVWPVGYAIAIVYLILFGSFDGGQFIYFQF